MRYGKTFEIAGNPTCLLARGQSAAKPFGKLRVNSLILLEVTFRDYNGSFLTL